MKKYFILAILGVMSMPYDIPYPAIIAHRGFSYLAPEETAPAYILAKEVGADYLEADIQRTKDGALIAVHDDTFERTTNIAEVFPSRQHDPVGSFTLEEVKRLDAGSWFNKAYPKRAKNSYVGLQILTLDELIDIAEGSRLYLETKSPHLYPGYEEQIIGLLRKRGWLEEGLLIFQSFDVNSLKILKAHAPHIPRVLLVDSKERLSFSEVIQLAKENAQGIGPSFLQSFPWRLAAAHRANLFVHPYTVDQKWLMWLLLKFGADGFFTNRPEVALNQRVEKFSRRP